MTADPFVGDRGQVLSYLEKQLLGPVGGPSEVVTDEAPHKRYLTGILFPLDAPASFAEEGEEEEGESVAGAEDGNDDPITLSGQLQPSSVGVTFVVDRDAGLTVEIRLGVYTRAGVGWARTPIELSGDTAVKLYAGQSNLTILDGRASIDAVWRPFGDRVIVTVTLVNRLTRSDRGSFDPSDCLLQVEMRCTPESGLVRPYPQARRNSVDPEEVELALLYRGVPTFAVGHGAAAVWGPTQHGGVAWVGTDYMPKVIVPGVTAEIEDLDRVLSFDFLSGAATDAGVVEELEAFISRYEDWMLALAATVPSLEAVLRVAADRNLDRIRTAVARMRSGVALLTPGSAAAHAFGLANRAMLLQMLRSSDAHAGSRHRRDYEIPPVPEHDESLGWRPFQLGFILSTLASIVDPNRDDHDEVDLLWFPTGGGKTEAYLGLVAFTIFHRRLTLGEHGSGTTVLTRYTLRLLTSQQFRRAATLICAAETLRRQSGGMLGATPISIGLWVGGSNTPNTYDDAVKLVEQMLDGDTPSQSFQVDLCPWCGTELFSRDDPDGIGITATNNHVGFRCPNRGCEFHGHLPLATVDAAIYDDPPTMVVGTVDKFARLAWEERSGVLLGAGRTPGPSLVIQDEFHLISGPLGSIVGAYEAAFDIVMAANGTRPKVIASTATIRRADQQSKGVFGRSVSLFPPSGLDADDSYFVRTDRLAPGRLYVGVMPQGHTPLTGMVQLSAAVLQAPEELELGPEGSDAYWTLVAYHNSLRELGKTVTLARDDIPARISVIADTEDGIRDLPGDSVMELTSQVKPSEIPGKIEALERRRGQAGCPSFVASSNMISVGVDVSRLGLMVVVGQPKTTSEYIQATSRVGRRAPGLVITLFSPSKPRDRSHFEGFVAYHEALYRSVEPTSVTPFSPPARQRTMPAAMVILARHAAGLPALTDAERFDEDDAVWATLRDTLLARVARSDLSELSAVEAEWARLELEWRRRQGQAASTGGLRYVSKGRAHVGLIRRFSESGDGWPTLDSMRNVDSDCRISVKGER